MSESNHFIDERIKEDLRTAKYGGQVVTRFPPEPNGYLHIGHAKAICISYGLAQKYGGTYNLRFDDTNPEVEETEYVDAIMADIRWLGFNWGENLFFASDYFPRLYGFAQDLIRAGKAYVCSQTEDQMRADRGTVTTPGTHSPDRDRDIEESLTLLEGMRTGAFDEGTYTLRAKIDMADPNMKMRDPAMYRIRHVTHHRTGDDWHIYPIYDFAHGLSDAIEGVTHSLCTLEFENNRELYDWYVEAAFDEPRPQQIEFARFNLTYVVMSKRWLLQLVQDKHVDGWDDPRMPTLAGMRRRGVPANAVVHLMERVGVAKADTTTEMEFFDHIVRDALNTEAPRVMAVIDPLKVVVTNWPDKTIDQLDADYWPHDVAKEGTRRVPFGGELYIERADFAMEPPKKWKRLAPDWEVRLRYGYLFTCDSVLLDDAGEVAEVHGHVDLQSRGGRSPDGRKVKGTIHWVNASTAVPCTFRLFDRLFVLPKPADHPDGFLAALNPNSLVLHDGFVEPSVQSDAPSSRYQFERQGYFMHDVKSSSEVGKPVYNRIVALRDSWSAPKPAATNAVATPADKAPSTERKRTRKSKSESLQELMAQRPELRDRLQTLLDGGLAQTDATLLTSDETLYELYAKAMSVHRNAPVITKWLVNTVRGALKSGATLDGAHLGVIVAAIDAGNLSTKQAKRVLSTVLKTGENPTALIERSQSRASLNEAELQAIIDEVLANHGPQVQEFRAGKQSLFGYFMGQVMRATKGKADPGAANTMLRSSLKN